MTPGLATTLKIGGWGHLGQFADKQFTNNGMLLANPASNGMPLMHRGDYGIYGVIDQQLYRLPGGERDSGISIFNRSAISPSDRNLVNVEIDGGIVFAGMIPQRPDDSFGASVIYSRFSNSVRAFDQEQINFGTLVHAAARLRDESRTHLCCANRKRLGRAAGLYLHLASERHRHPVSRRAGRGRALDHQVLKSGPARTGT